MQHPIFSNKITIGSYLFIGAVFIVIDFLLIHYGYKCSVTTALIYALVYDVIIILLGGSLWYPVYFLDRNKGSIFSVIQLVFLGFVFLGIWAGSAWGILSILEGNFSFTTILNSDFVLIRLLIGVLIYLLFISVYFLMIRSQNEEEYKKEKLELKNLLTDTELNLLKSQLNPHFLFNSLNSISSLTLYDAEGAREMISKLSDFLRYSLRNNQHKLLPLKEELENFRRYMDIERIRFGDKINFIEQIKLDCEKKMVPALIIQPLIENAIKYGVYNSIHTTNIELHGYLKNGDLIISLQNDYENDMDERIGEGLGLSNTKARMRKIYGSKDLVRIQKREQTFLVELTIPQFLQ
ncbi:sensor histidine kinase [Plebeiibacterium sediminum]|uniref:Histidine kinase n=1 Tax=Plebeiibacterium sediminum TaxID=2992112 RepID=A0AAE3M0W8_9BACT|nr:histidine kinase [Plebeiobacterium sediminum]MCW3785003.1 histidine kinase [Plebeiobacterium sediminum]